MPSSTISFPSLTSWTVRFTQELIGWKYTISGFEESWSLVSPGRLYTLISECLMNKSYKSILWNISGSIPCSLSFSHPLVIFLPWSSRDPCLYHLSNGNFVWGHKFFKFANCIRGPNLETQAPPGGLYQMCPLIKTLRWDNASKIISLWVLSGHLSTYLAF